MTDRDLEPACAETSHAEEWRPAVEFDFRSRSPCQRCFGVESVEAIDAPLDHLLVATGDSGYRIHISSEHGEPTYDQPIKQSALAPTLADPDVGPADLGLDPLEGGGA